MRKGFKKTRLLLKIILICISLSFTAVNFYAEEQLPPKSETVTEKMYGDRLPSVKKIINNVNIEVSEILLGSESGFNRLADREDKLDLKTRELCTVSILTALLGSSEELLFHISVAHKLGWTLQEIKEAQILCIISAGWPKALNGLKTFFQFCEANKIPFEEDLNIRDDFYTRDWLKTGNEKGIKLFGKDQWNAFYSELSSVDTYLADYTVSTHYGKLYTRTILNERAKSLCMISANAALRNKKSLRLSIIGALNSGVSREEIKEILFHVGGYAGQEASLDAIEVYKSITS
jgi:4-carboxymuconolactone decarboxylase